MTPGDSQTNLCGSITENRHGAGMGKMSTFDDIATRIRGIQCDLVKGAELRDALRKKRLGSEVRATIERALEERQIGWASPIPNSEDAVVLLYDAGASSGVTRMINLVERIKAREAIIEPIPLDWAQLKKAAEALRSQ